MLASMHSVCSKEKSNKKTQLNNELTVMSKSNSDLKAILALASKKLNNTKLVNCIKNARIMKLYSEEFGSFGELLDQKKGNIDELKELMLNFPSVGDAVALDFLKDIGMDFVKPDVHVLRVFYRLGLIQAETCFDEALKVAEAFKQTTSEKMSVIDAVFWMYGGGGDGHVERAMCNKNSPYCNQCPLTIFCYYYKGLLH